VFERFTDRARRVVVLAQEEARLLNHNYIGTEHLLLGLIHEGEGVAARALESVEISLTDVRAQVEEIIGHGGQSPSGHIPFTPRAKKVLELSLREALQLGHNYIGTEHILLGLIREGEGVAAQVLATLGADLSRVRQAVIQLLSGYAPPPEVRLDVVDEPRFTQHVAFTRDEIRVAACGFCGVESPQCGTLLTGRTGALICERCIRVASRSLRMPRVFAQPLTAGEPVEVLAARITPTGPPPEDEDAAGAAVIDVFLRRAEASEDGESLPNVVGGENLGQCQREIRIRVGEIASRTTTTVELVKFLNDHEAVLWWTVMLDGRQVLGTREGRVVLVDAAWKVTRETMCAGFALAGVQCPPPPEPPVPEPPAPPSPAA
jgi:Clp amino terminal domain, pathogenicity island component/ClpX C4-type zinc finger